MATDGCETAVYGDGLCYGKAGVKMAECQPSDGGYITDFVKAMPRGSCTIMGDPHILPFDNSYGIHGDVTQLSPGVYNLVVSPDLLIQGMFGFSSRFPSASSLIGIAASGPFVGGRVAVMYTGPETGPSGFQTLWGNETIVPNMGDRFKDDEGNIYVRTGRMNPTNFQPQARHTIEGTDAEDPRDMPSIYVQLGNGVELFLLLGNDTMNAVIVMDKLPDGQDGYCGNFNCNSTDDTMSALQGRGFAYTLPQTLSIFDEMPVVPIEALEKHGEVRPVQQCPPELYAQAEKECGSMSERALKEGCIFDVCTSGDVTAGRADVATEALAENVMAMWSPFSLLQRIPVAAQVAFFLALAAIFLARAGFGLSPRWTSRRRHYDPLSVSCGEPEVRTGLMFHDVTCEVVDDEEDDEDIEFCTNEKQVLLHRV